MIMNKLFLLKFLNLTLTVQLNVMVSAMQHQLVWNDLNDGHWAFFCDFHTMTNLLELNANTFTICHDKCKTMPECTHYTWNAKNLMCQLKSGRIHKEDAVFIGNGDVSCGLFDIVEPSVSQEGLVSYDEFVSAVTKSGYAKPSVQIYDNFNMHLESEGLINTKREAAMLLAHVLVDSVGLTEKCEERCKQTGCPGEFIEPSYPSYPNQSYFARGYARLTWNYNYLAASQDLFSDDRLLRDPEQVARNDEIAWLTTLWNWRVHVGVSDKVKEGNFGMSTFLLNRNLCNGNDLKGARVRFEKYRLVLAAFNCKETPIENGCYN